MIDSGVPECSGPEPLGATDRAASRPPTVSVLVLNVNGRHHLEWCLPSLEAQTYPRDLFEIVVVDNGSTDGSLTFVRERHPGVRIISYEGNRGFAGGYNTATGLCHTDFLAFLNNDTRVEPGWLAELVAAADRHGAASVASRILDWSGERIDFAGGIVSIVGHAWPRDAGQPATRKYDEDRLLFACGGSMLVRRDVFLDAGRFDPRFFAYFEDVDLGWRMSLLGHTTVFAPSAVTHHRLHGTAGRWALAPRLRLYERNALMMIYKNYERETLARVLPAAIALAVARACAQSPLDPRTFEFGRSIPDRVWLSPRTIAHLIGLEEFASSLPVLEEERSKIQRRRRVSDADLLPLFRDPLRLHDLGPAYDRMARTLMAEFEIDRFVKGGGRFPAQAAQTDREPPEPARPPVTTGYPDVSIVILVAGDPAHLPECLASLRAQSYPADRRDVIVVDNGSAEDPTMVVERSYPGARVIRNGSNLGFAAGNNVGARAARGEYVAFLNDDTRAHPDWLTELVGAARRRGAACVASRILSWDGQRIDFAGGSANFEGKGFQAGYGSRVGAAMAERPLFFACGASMMVDRRTFLDAGGWDEETFAYYEDLELGWRLWLIGEEVWFAPSALVFHKHHGTSGRTVEASRVRLYERNSLRMLYTHLEREHLERVLPAALLLSADRVLLDTGLGRGQAGDATTGDTAGWLERLARAGAGLPRLGKRELAARGAGRHLSWTGNLRRVGVRGLVGAARRAIGDALRNIRPSAARPRLAYLMEFGSPGRALDVREEWVPAGAGAALTGIKEFLDSLPELERRRERLQARRRRSDLEILAPFNTEWLSVSPAAHQKFHNELHQVLAGVFRIGEIAGAASRDDEPSAAEVEYERVRDVPAHVTASRLRRVVVAGVGLTRGVSRLASRPLPDLWRSLRDVPRKGLGGTIRQLIQLGMLADPGLLYERWVAANTPTADDVLAMAGDVAAFAFQPRISIVTPVFNTDPRWLRACIESVGRQVYQNWELCLCDDGSTSEATLDALREAEASDGRVRVTYLPDNRGICGASNAALATATGDFVAMLDHDDELTPDALYQVVKFLNDHDEHARADLIYSDEDKLDARGQRCDPYFKPDWSPDHFLSCMYACHLLVIRRSLMIEVGGFRMGYEGAQDYDLVLRVTARTSRVYRVPHVLYHWRKTEGSAAGSGLAKPWAVDAGRRAIADYAAHAGTEADVEMGSSPGQYRLRHRLRATPLVSIVMAGGSARAPMASSDEASLLRCARSLERTSYENYEVIVVEDGSLSDTTRAAIETRRSRCVTLPATELDLASRVNAGVHQAGGAHVVVCCDLVEVRNGDWLTSMLEYSEQAAIGAVGAKLFYPDGRLRHVGVVLGVGGVAALPFHGFPGSSCGHVSSAVGIRNYSAVSGSCLMTRREVFDEVGGFRAAFGVGFGDLDYCLRLRRAGYRIVFTPYAELTYRGADLGPILQGDAREVAEMRRVWRDVLKSDPFYNPQLTTDSIDYRPRTGRPDE